MRIRDNQKKSLPYWDLAKVLADLSSFQQFFPYAAANILVSKGLRETEGAFNQIKF